MSLKNKTVTKEMIDNLAKRLVNGLAKREYANVSVYYNNKRTRIDGKWSRNDDGEYVMTTEIITEENINPHDYFECAYNHILSMAFEGELYDYCYDNLTFPKWMESIFKQYNLMYEFADSWNVSFYPNEDGWEYEFTIYEEPERETTLYRWECYPEYPWFTGLVDACDKAYETYGVNGSIICGSGFHFKVDSKPFFYNTGYDQSDLVNVDGIREYLESINATDIVYDWGRMD